MNLLALSFYYECLVQISVQTTFFVSQLKLGILVVLVATVAAVFTVSTYGIRASSQNVRLR